MSEVKFTDQNFEAEVLKHQGLVLVDFWAPWCGPCQAMGPIIDEVAKELDGKVKVGKINIDENNETANKFGVQSIPTLIIFKNGEIQDQTPGIADKAAILKKINEFLTK